jgi:hypothetical protein
MYFTRKWYAYYAYMHTMFWKYAIKIFFILNFVNDTNNSKIITHTRISSFLSNFRVVNFLRNVTMIFLSILYVHIKSMHTTYIFYKY